MTPIESSSNWYSGNFNYAHVTVYDTQIHIKNSQSYPT